MTIKPDLRLPEYKSKEHINWSKLLIIFILVVYIAGLGFWYWMMEQDLADLESELASEQELEDNLTQELGEYRNIQELREKYETKSERLEYLQNGHIVWSHHLQDLSDNIPQGVRIMEYNASDLDAVYISGSSTSVLEAMTFSQELANNTAHEEINIDFISENEDVTDGHNYLFDIEAKLDVSALEFTWESDNAEAGQEDEDDAN